MARTCPEPKPIFIALLVAGAALGQAAAMALWRALVHLSGGMALAGRGMETWVAGGTLGLAAGFGLAYAVSLAMVRGEAWRLVWFWTFFSMAHRSAVWIWYVLAIPNYGVPWWSPRGLLASAVLAAVPVLLFHLFDRFRWRFWTASLVLVLAGVLAGTLMAAAMEVVLPTGAPWQFSDTWFDMPVSWAFIFSAMLVAARVARKLDRQHPIGAQ